MKLVHSTLITGFLAAAIAAACGSSNDTSGGAGGAGGTGGSSGSAGSAGSNDAGGAGGSAGSPDASTDGSDGGTPATCAMGSAATIADVVDGTKAPAGTQVQITGAIATSKKFSVSKSKKSGTCLWGVFLSDPVATATPGTAVLAVSKGDKSPSDGMGGYTGECPTGTDAIPEDVAPGDELTLTGTADAFVQKACATMMPSPAKQVQISDVCAVTKTGTKTVPAPLVLTSYTDIENVADATTMRKYGGLLVQLQNVPAVDVDGGPVGQYGVITLDLGGGKTIPVNDKLYYGGTGSGPVFGSMTTFQSVTAFYSLDYCTWSLWPADKCTSFSPPSTDCAGGDAGTGDATSGDASDDATSDAAAD